MRGGFEKRTVGFEKGGRRLKMGGGFEKWEVGLEKGGRC